MLASISVVSCVTGPAVDIDTSGLALSESPPSAPILSSRSSMASCASPCSPSSSQCCVRGTLCRVLLSESQQPGRLAPAQWRRRRDTPEQLCHLLLVLAGQRCHLLLVLGLLLGGVALDFLEKVVLSCEQRREAILNGLCESSRQLRSARSVCGAKRRPMPEAPQTCVDTEDTSSAGGHDSVRGTRPGGRVRPPAKT